MEIRLTDEMLNDHELVEAILTNLALCEFMEVPAKDSAKIMDVSERTYFNYKAKLKRKMERRVLEYLEHAMINPDFFNNSKTPEEDKQRRLALRERYFKLFRELYPDYQDEEVQQETKHTILRGGAVQIDR